MKALSLKQPWASLIASGVKTIETRTWATNYRGPLLICAGKGRYSTVSLVGDSVHGAFPAGMALCVVDVVHCRLMRAEDWKAAACEAYPDAWGWELENLRLIEPFAVKGQLKLFNVADELIRFSIGSAK